ncbi:hypothetical protein TESS_TESS_00298 [Tessaracoccus sp. O5.2]|uniref:hypothetical protein n=1 Tax=Tessaracoccus sp. O5.2 TaxID=3157622 RepID=UPI0035EC3B48
MGVFEAEFLDLYGTSFLWVGVGAIVLTTVVAVLAYRFGTRGVTRPEVDAEEAVRLAEADLRKEKVDA